MVTSYSFASGENKFKIFKFPGHVEIHLDPIIEVPMVDILFVVDDSGSMISHQQNLASHIDRLVNKLIGSGVDFHGGIISGAVDPKNDMGYLRGNPLVVKSDDANAKESLSRNLLLGTNGHWEESVFSPIMAALSEPLKSGVNKGFRRDHAALAIVLLTDAAEQSDITATKFIDFLNTKLSVGKEEISVNGVLVPTDNTFICNRDGDLKPIQLEQVIAEYGGEVLNLCSPIFGKGIEKIAENILERLSLGLKFIRRIPLTIEPNVDSIEVTYGIQVIVRGDLRRGWVYDVATNDIVLGKELKLLSQNPRLKLVVKFVPVEWE